MKKLLQSLLFLLTFSVTSSFASSGIFDGYAVVNSTYYDLITATANPDFQGANLGIFNAGTGFTLGGQIKTFKNGADNICAGRLKYSIFLSTGSPGVFSTVNLPFDTNLLNPGDQQWTTAPGGIVANGLAPGNYKIAVWVADQGDGAGGCTLDPFHTSDNGGSYWIATFTVIPNPITPITVVSTGGTLLATYATVAAAVTAINVGTHTGTITCYLPAGYTETAPAGGYALTATGTAPNPITFIKSGAGANPVFTAFLGQTSGLINDAVFKLLGSDYVTFDGLTLQENVANTTTASATNNMTEFGFALFYAGANGAAANGAQNNTIQNCTISLNRSYLNTFCIYSSSITTSTAMTTTDAATTAAGVNSFNKIYANNISNVNFGIVFIGTSVAAAFESGNDIGGTSAVTGNTITNWGGGAALSGYFTLTGSNYAIFSNRQINDNISFNTITSAALAQGVTVGGILKNYTITQPTGTITTTINNNTVTVTNNPSATTTGGIVGINNQGLTPLLSTATMSMNNNTVQNCVLGGSTSTTNSITAITNLSLPGTMNITGNSVINNAITATTATTGSLNGISNSGAAGTLNINNNIVRGFASTGTSSQIAGVNQSGAIVNAININNNQLGNSSVGFFSNSNATSGNLFGISNSAASSTCATTITGNDIRGIVYNVASSGSNTYITSTGTPLTNNVSTNTFTNLNVNTTGSVTFISNGTTVPATGSQTISNNSIVTGFNKSGAGGTITLSTSSSSSVAGAVITHKGNNFSDITVTGATTISGWANFDGGTANKSFTNNTFTNWTGGTSSITAMSVSFGGGAGGLGNVLSGNIINNFSSAGNITGIAYGSSGTNASIFGNTINSLSSTGASAVVGISTSAASLTNVYKNNVYDLSSSNASGTVSGINVISGTAINLYNNFVSDIRNSAANAAVPIYGINVSGGTNVGLYNNTVALGKTTPLTSSGGQFGVTGIGYSSTTNTTLRNNIVWIDQPQPELVPLQQLEEVVLEQQVQRQLQLVL